MGGGAGGDGDGVQNPQMGFFEERKLNTNTSGNGRYSLFFFYYFEKSLICSSKG